MIWQTRTLATFTAATVPVENAGQANPLLERALAIGQPEESTQSAEHSAAVPAEPAQGSFERFMATFGNPKRWAGR